MKIYLLLVCSLSLYVSEYAASAQTKEQEIQQRLDTTKQEKKAAVEKLDQTLAEFEKEGFTSESSAYFKTAAQDIADLAYLIEKLSSEYNRLERLKLGGRARFRRRHPTFLYYINSVHKKAGSLFDQQVGKILIQIQLLADDQEEKELARIKAKQHGLYTDIYKAARQPQQKLATPEQLEQLSAEQKKEAIILPHQPELRELITQYAVESATEERAAAERQSACGQKEAGK
jgi:hypothetical protein